MKKQQCLERVMQIEQDEPGQFIDGSYDSQSVLIASHSRKVCEEAVKSGFAVLPLFGGENSDTCDLGWGYPYIAESLDDMSQEELEEVFCRQKKLPLIIAKTKHLVIRETIAEDLEALAAIYEEEADNPGLHGLFGTHQGDREIELMHQGLERYRECQYEYYGYGMWSVLLKSGTASVVIGRIGLELIGENLSLGFVIKQSERRKGYASEACLAVTAYASRREWPEIVVRTSHANSAAKHLAQKLGLKVIEE